MKLSKKNVPFTMVANEVLNDSDLSWKAKGVYAYLFSKPDGWQFSADRIIKDGTSGRREVLAALKELENSNLLERKKLGDGRMEYHIKFSDPECGNRTLLKPHSAEIGSISNKDSINNTDTINNKDSTQKVDKTVDELWTEMITPFIGSLAPRTRTEFENYWRQKNKNGKKELWQMQKVFDMGRRLNTWKINEDKFQQQKEARQQLKKVDEMPVHRRVEPVVRVDTGLQRIKF